MGHLDFLLLAIDQTVPEFFSQLNPKRAHNHKLVCDWVKKRVGIFEHERVSVRLDFLEGQSGEVSPIYNFLQITTTMNTTTNNNCN